MPGKKNKKTPGIGNETLPHLFLGLKALADSKAKYIIVGGIATNLHGLSTATKDIDVLIPKDLENTEKILKGLENLGWGLSKELFAEDVIKKPFTIIGDQPRVDLLLIAGKINFEQAYPNREQKTIEGIKIPYLNIEDLILSKQTGRPKDKIIIQDLKRLIKIKGHKKSPTTKK